MTPRADRNAAALPCLRADGDAAELACFGGLPHPADRA